MKFWDSSAIIPLCLKEAASEAIRRLARTDGDILVWWASRGECLRAERLLTVHPLRAAEALQLAAALLWAEDTPRGLDFVRLDQNLCEAALNEGFTARP